MQSTYFQQQQQKFDRSGTTNLETKTSQSDWVKIYLSRRQTVRDKRKGFFKRSKIDLKKTKKLPESLLEKPKPPNKRVK